ncbi:MAG: hypothetical protein LBU41_03780 [Clostridiales Family XIII bacterium]|jgi:cell division protein FtsL|nr:hypothetical protein [Clostridiales Family XIII bacterium]
MAVAAKQLNKQYRSASQYESAYAFRSRAYAPEEEDTYAGSFAYSDGYAAPGRRYRDWDYDREYELPYDDRWADENEREAVRPKRVPYKSAAERRKQAGLVLGVIVLVIVFFGMIFLSAYCAEIQRDINKTNSKITRVQDEIYNLNVELEQNKSVAFVSDRAGGELGMIYPDNTQIVYVKDIVLPVSTETMESEGE